MKKCSRCKENKTLDNFGKDKRRKDGKSIYCKPCSKANNAISRNKQKHLPCTVCKEAPRAKGQTRCRDCHNATQKSSKYGITMERALELSQRPCAACGRYEHEIGGKHPMSIDHCHGTGRVRDVLCRYCNVALGMLLDDPIRIEQLKQYALLQAQKHHEVTTARGS